MKIEYGEIIPGVRLGEFTIGMKKEDVIKKLKNDYKEEIPWDAYNHRICLENAIIGFDDNDFVQGISVTKGFKGKYKEVLMIGATLEKISKVLGEYKQFDDPISVDYKIKGIEGMSFRLKEEDDDENEDDDWYEKNLPIEWLTIYRIRKSATEMADFIVCRLDGFFGERLADYVIEDVVNDSEYGFFSVKFSAYNYFPMRFEYDRGRFACYIDYGIRKIKLESSQKLWYNADFNTFLKEIKTQLELRIPDKFLRAKGWM